MSPNIVISWIVEHSTKGVLYCTYNLMDRCNHFIYPSISCLVFFAPQSITFSSLLISHGTYIYIKTNKTYIYRKTNKTPRHTFFIIILTVCLCRFTLQIVLHDELVFLELLECVLDDGDSYKVSY